MFLAGIATNQLGGRDVVHDRVKVQQASARTPVIAYRNPCAGIGHLRVMCLHRCKR
jgi:hypothetical protein